MKTAIIISDWVTQVVFTPESEDEKKALKLFDIWQDVEILIKSWNIFWYSHTDRNNLPFTASPKMCQWWYLRMYEDAESRIFVIKPKDKSE